MSKLWPLLAVLALLAGIFLGLLLAPVMVPTPEALPVVFDDFLAAEQFNDFAAKLGCASLQAVRGDRIDEARAALRRCLSARPR